MISAWSENYHHFWQGPIEQPGVYEVYASSLASLQTTCCIQRRVASSTLQAPLQCGMCMACCPASDVTSLGIIITTLSSQLKRFAGPYTNKPEVPHIESASRLKA